MSNLLIRGGLLSVNTPWMWEEWTAIGKINLFIRNTNVFQIFIQRRHDKTYFIQIGSWTWGFQPKKKKKKKSDFGGGRLERLGFDLVCSDRLINWIIIIIRICLKFSYKNTIKIILIRIFNIIVDLGSL